MFMKHSAPNRCEPSMIEFREAGQGRCERRSDFFGGEGGGGGWVVGGGGVRVDVNGQVKFL